MNLKSKNGVDVLTLDAAERRCLYKAIDVLRQIEGLANERVMGDSALEESCAKAQTNIEDALSSVDHPKPRAKAGAEK